MYKSVKPFIKWAGGKSQLLDDIRKKYPDKIDKYCEPFVGGGAVLLDVLANFSPEQVLINDINPELTNTYTKIRDNVEEIIDFLEKMQSDFWALDKESRKTYYYDKRDRFNDLILQSVHTAEQAALFIFLNKTCFNGLYRVNAKGLYNVPMGDYKKPPICDPENLRLISELLKGCDIICGEYSSCKDFIDGDTFVYIDPPYRPLNETSSFTSYAKTEFGDQQQIELGHFIDEITAKGAKVVTSNSDPKNTNDSDDFFDTLYSKYVINRVQATRMINSNDSQLNTISSFPHSTLFDDKDFKKDINVFVIFNGKIIYIGCLLSDKYAEPFCNNSLASIMFYCNSFCIGSIDDTRKYAEFILTSRKVTIKIRCRVTPCTGRYIDASDYYNELSNYPYPLPSTCIKKSEYCSLSPFETITLNSLIMCSSQAIKLKNMNENPCNQSVVDITEVIMHSCYNAYYVFSQIMKSTDDFLVCRRIPLSPFNPTHIDKAEICGYNVRDYIKGGAIPNIIIGICNNETFPLIHQRTLNQIKWLNRICLTDEFKNITFYIFYNDMLHINEKHILEVNKISSTKL